MKSLQHSTVNIVAILAVALYLSCIQPTSAKPSWKLNKFLPSEIQSVSDIEELLGATFPQVLDIIADQDQINAVLEVVRTCDRDNRLESCLRKAIRKSVEAMKRDVDWHRVKTEL